MPRPPHVSIIMPAWNAASTIAESIESVQQQSCGNWELLIVDDASSDATPEIAASAAQRDARIRLLAQPTNAGPGRARNLALREATGRFVAFLDADDLWLTGKLERQIQEMQRRGAGILASGYRRMSANGHLMGRTISPPQRITMRHVRFSNPIGTLTAVVDLDRTGPFRMPNCYYDDFALWVMLLQRGIQAVGIPDDLARYRLNPNGLSANKFRSARHSWHVLRSANRGPLVLPAFARYIARGLRDARRYRPTMRESSLR